MRHEAREQIRVKFGKLTQDELADQLADACAAAYDQHGSAITERAELLSAALRDKRYNGD